MFKVIINFKLFAQIYYFYASNIFVLDDFTLKGFTLVKLILESFFSK